jgi:hypothetical protein
MFVFDEEMRFEPPPAPLYWCADCGRRLYEPDCGPWRAGVRIAHRDDRDSLSGYVCYQTWGPHRGVIGIPDRKGRW